MKSLPTNSCPLQAPSRQTGRVQAKSEFLPNHGMSGLMRCGWGLGTAAIFLALSVSGASGQTVILDNNFDSVAVASYNQATGQSLGTTATLGNATYINSASVVATGGVGNSARYGNGNTEMGVRSRVGTWDFENKTEFSMYFKHGAGFTANYGDAYVGAGWALAAGTDGSNLYSNNTADRFLVGLMGPSGAANYSTVQFAALGGLASRQSLSSSNMTLTAGNWYKLSFGLDFDGTNTWAITGLSLDDYGTTGSTLVGNMGTLGTINLNPTAFGVNLDTATGGAFAYFAGNRGRGIDMLDNLSATVPEPAPWGLIALSLTTVVVFRRRLSKFAQT